MANKLESVETTMDDLSNIILKGIEADFRNRLEEKMQAISNEIINKVKHETETVIASIAEEYSQLIKTNVKSYYMQNWNTAAPSIVVNFSFQKTEKVFVNQ